MRTASFRADNPGRGEAHDPAELRAAIEHARAAFAEHMDDDLNTAGALGELFALGRELFRYVGATDAAGQAADVATLEEVEDLLVECLDDLCIALPDASPMFAAGAGAGYAPANAEPTGDGEVCATEDVPLPPAERLAGEGRWADLAELADERLACGDAVVCLPAARPLPGREGLGQRRRPARTPRSRRLRGARHAGRHAGRPQA